MIEGFPSSWVEST